MLRKLMILSMLVLASSGCGGKGEISDIKLGIGFIPHIQFAPLYLGMEKGFFKEEGINLSIDYGFGMDIFSLLENEKIDIGLSDSDQLITAHEKGIGLKAVFQYYQDYPVSIISKDKNISTPYDLTGKKIGTPELFGSSYIGLELFLKKYSLKENIEVVRIGYSQISSLLNNQVDAVVCFYNNEPVQIRSMGTSLSQWDIRDFSGMVGASFITSSGIIKKKKDVLRRFIRALRKSLDYTCKNQEESFNLSLKYLNDMDEEGRKIMRKILARTCELLEAKNGRDYGYLDTDKYQESIDILKDLGLIAETYPAEEIVCAIR